jgi:hypothetical protein
MTDGYYWITYPGSEPPEIVRVSGNRVEGFWNCECSLEELVAQGARFHGPIMAPHLRE